MAGTFPEWIYDGSPIDDPLGHGEKAVQFLRRLRHPNSTEPGRAFQLYDWQERIVRRIYGPRHPDGRRIVKTVMLLLPRGNRKTSLAAALALLHLFGPESRAAGQVVFAACDREQASIGFREAANIIREDRRLMQAVTIRDAFNSKKQITFGKNSSTLTALASDGGAAHGLSRPPEQALVASCEEDRPADQVKVGQLSLNLVELDIQLADLSDDQRPKELTPDCEHVPNADMADEPPEEAESRPAVQEAVAQIAEPAPARVFDELALAPGCFGSALSFNAEDTICQACPFNAKCQPVHEIAKNHLHDKFGIAIPSPDPGQKKIEVPSRATRKKQINTKSYHKTKPPLRNAKPSQMPPEDALEHTRARKRKNKQDSRAAQRAEKLAEESKVAAAQTGGPLIT